jgi:hypothetical protein
MIEVSFTFTPERLTDALKHYRRQVQQPHQLVWILIFFFLLIPIFGLDTVAWVIESLIFLSVLLLIIAPYVAAWFALRSFHKSPFCNEQITQRFDDTGLHETSGTSDSHFAWTTFTSAVLFDDGFLLFSGPKFFRWIPNNAFVNPNQILDFQQLVRANLDDDTVIEHANDKGVKESLKTFLHGFYLGLIGDDFSRRERSKTFRWSIRGFWLSFFLLMVVACFATKNVYWMAIGMGAVCLLMISGVTFIFSIAARDIRKWKQNKWRFSIRDLLIVITAIALALGGLMIAARN